MVGEDFENPFGKTSPKGKLRMMSELLDSGVFPGTQGGPLEHIIAAKAIGYGEALSDSYMRYILQVKQNADLLADLLIEKGYQIISGGTDNHLMLIDLRSKNITGRDAENALVRADITVNKNMVPFDDKSPMVTSGIRIGVPAVTTRGLKEDDMKRIANLIDNVLTNHTNESVIGQVKKEINDWMSSQPLFA